MIIVRKNKVILFSIVLAGSIGLLSGCSTSKEMSYKKTILQKPLVIPDFLDSPKVEGSLGVPLLPESFFEKKNDKRLTKEIGDAPPDFEPKGG